MCQHCDKKIIEMEIFESDLPNLPYKLVYWGCCAVGCKGKAKLRDYGISPYYYWPVKVVRQIGKGGIGRWRGGWINVDHTYICSKHFAEFKKGAKAFYKKYVFDPLETLDENKINEYLFSKIISVTTKQKTNGSTITSLSFRG